MFSIRKAKNRLSRHVLADHRPDHAFHPRVETLEGRALPSVTLLPFSRPLVIVVEQASFNFSFIVRIDVAPLGFGSPGMPFSRGAALANAGTASQIAANQTTDSQAASNATSSLTSQQSSALAALPAASAAPTVASDESALLSSFASASAPTAPRPIAFRPPVGEQMFFPSGFVTPADQPLVLNTVVLPAPVNNLTLDLRFAKPQPAVQAIVNRMEFMGSAVTVAENSVPADAPSDPSIPPPRPVEPPPAGMEDAAPADGLAGLSLSQAALAAEAPMPDGMDLGAIWEQAAEEHPILAPELVSEVAMLAACSGGFRMQKEVAAWRGAQIAGMEIVVKKKRSRP